MTPKGANAFFILGLSIEAIVLGVGIVFLDPWPISLSLIAAAIIATCAVITESQRRRREAHIAELRQRLDLARRYGNEAEEQLAITLLQIWGVNPNK